MSDTQAQTRPAVRSGVVPYLSVRDASAAAEFYKRAFGAEEVMRNGEEGKIMHLHLYIHGGSVMLSDFFPDHGYPFKEPQAFNLYLQLDGEVDAWWERAVAAGAEVVTPLAVQFWGDRYGQLRDPFGVIWGLGAAQG